MAKIPMTHRHASIASIPHSKEYKVGWERTFGEGQQCDFICQSVKGGPDGLLKCSLQKYHKGDHKWVKE